MSQDYLKKATNLINEAIEFEQREHYEYALNSYKSAFHWFELVLKYDTRPRMKEIINAKFLEYLDRAEDIKAMLAKQKKPNTKASVCANQNGESDTDDDTNQLNELRKILLKTIQNADHKVTWNDVIGLNAAKQSLKEATILPMSCPSLFQKADITPWTGILLYGPPGTGKTWVARAVATESNATFFNVSASTIMSKWQGESAKLVKTLFQLAVERSPSIIFMDELETLCGSRENTTKKSGSMGSVITELLVCMSEIVGKNVLVLGATNLPWTLDEAFLRRFQRRIHVPLPVERARISLFALLTKNNYPKMYKKLARETEGYSGSDIKNIVNETKYKSVLKVCEGTHFVMDKITKIYTPCSSGEEGAIEMSYTDVDESCLNPAILTKRDFLKSISGYRPTVSVASIEKHKSWEKTLTI